MLVVDDEPAIRLLCRLNLELEGYAVLEARSLEEARTVLAAQDVAVVLLDMHIGNDRGDTLVRELRQDGVPVIIVSGSTELEALTALDPSAVLGKPFEIEELLAAVKSVAR